MWALLDNRNSGGNCLTAQPSKKLLESIAWHQDQLRHAFEMTVNLLYVIDSKDASGDGRFVIPCREVYRAIADDLKIPMFRRGFQRYCKDVLIDMGALQYRCDGYTMFRGIRNRNDCEAKAEEESRRWKVNARWERQSPGSRVLGYSGNAPSQNTDVGTWEKILAGEGLPAEISHVVAIDPLKESVNIARLEKATEAYWRIYRDQCILRLFMEGKAIIPIANLLKIGRRVVWNRLKFYGLSDSEEEIKK